MWNYRIVRHRTRRITWYGLHEVYYDKSRKVTLWAPRPSATGDSPKDLIAGLAMQLRDATNSEAPILDQKDMPGKTKAMTTCEHCGHKLKAIARKAKARR